MAGRIRTSANLSSIGQKGQALLSSSEIAIAGIGGVGGIAFELLVRAGIGKIRIADSGFFEESNANRQSLWASGTNGCAKTKVAQEFAKSINPKCKVKAFPDIDGKNATAFVSGCSALIDATDRLASRILVWRGCKEAKVPYIYASATRWRGMLSVFKKADFEHSFALSNKKFNEYSSPGTFGPAANTMGCLAASQAMNIVLHKPTMAFPSVLSLDLFSNKPAAIHKF